MSKTRAAPRRAARTVWPVVMSPDVEPDHFTRQEIRETVAKVLRERSEREKEARAAARRK